MKIVFVHAATLNGNAGFAVGAISAGSEPALFDLTGNGHVGESAYEAVIRALVLSSESGQPLDLRTSYQVVARHLEAGHSKSDKLRPLFERTRTLVSESGSRVSWVPVEANPAAQAVSAKLRTMRRPGPESPHAAPESFVVGDRLRAALIAAGWTPPCVSAGPVLAVSPG